MSLAKRYKVTSSIYVLTDLYNNVFYVGCTVRPVERRLKLHLFEARYHKFNTNTLKNEKIRSLNFQILIKAIDQVSSYCYTGRNASCSPKARRLELEWILKYHNMGCELTNAHELKRALRKCKTKKLTVTVK